MLLSEKQSLTSSHTAAYVCVGVRQLIRWFHLVVQAETVLHWQCCQLPASKYFQFHCLLFTLVCTYHNVFFKMFSTSSSFSDQQGCVFSSNSLHNYSEGPPPVCLSACQRQTCDDIFTIAILRLTSEVIGKGAVFEQQFLCTYECMFCK